MNQETLDKIKKWMWEKYYSELTPTEVLDKLGPFLETLVIN